MISDLRTIHGLEAAYSPALLFFQERIERNIQNMLHMAGGPDRLRPHAKTHKCREIVGLLLAAGIQKHKCATIAEAELLAACGVPDVLLAYPIVGPNAARMARLAQAYPRTAFCVLADHPEGLRHLEEAFRSVSPGIQVMLDLDVGQHRTGLPPGDPAAGLYEAIARTKGLAPGGLHVYDGHNHIQDPEERAAAVRKGLEPVLAFRDALLRRGLEVPRLVCGGTPTFPAYAGLDLPGLECAPGTCVLHDHSYATKFPDLPFTPAALLLTRVVSRPLANRVTFDLGYKAVASDPPAGSRCVILDLPDGKAVLQNEEHLVIETDKAGRYRPGDMALAVPFHVCPTCAMHKEALVVRQGAVADRWAIAARDRVLAI